MNEVYLSRRLVPIDHLAQVALAIIPDVAGHP